MIKLAFVLLGCFFSALAFAYQPQEGDIIFHSSTSSQSQAIQFATGSRYSHMGIVLFKQGKPYVYEAVATVRYTPLDRWIKRGARGQYLVKRLKTPLTAAQVRQLHEQGKAFQNKPYDLTFDWSNERMYCSELVWKMYQRATGLEIGQLQKVREFNLTAPAVQQKIKERYGKNVPLDAPVISPVAMLNSPLLKTVPL
ncbi:hypothetical protein PL78_05335 [Yersinia entomophaga]|uniref:Peptidoglycan peptidase n=1 Tax=Yersinia entomophaga TaxID=935293 RepID=A0ABM6BJ39_YERET|nr:MULTISPECIES: YiiX family permuted papain-like enzyme [Yersinia]ANI29263.1 hypothetical protein PL78_05335 [Yersinia entomophaga]